MTLTSSMEDYLEAVLIVQKKRGYVRCVNVAEQLGVTKPSVSRAVKELSKSGHIIKTESGTLSLTEVGKNLAEQLYERHCFFTQHLIAAGVDPKIVEHDACNLEHVISEESFQKLKDVLENQGGGDNMGN